MYDGPPNPPFHVMVKPVGPTCNLDCAYCYYLDKQRLLYGQGNPPPRMSDELLERFIIDHVAANRDAPEIAFAWQGGEPTLMGLPFFRRAVQLQKKHAPAGTRVSNSIQTNGTLIDEDLARFFHDNHFLVGLSLDGPRDLHDAYRRDKAGRPTFDRVMAGLELLKRFRVEFNALVVVSRQNARRPAEVYRFLRDVAGVQFVQFIPAVAQSDSPQITQITQISVNKNLRNLRGNLAVTDWSVQPDDFGAFLCGVFDEWLARDVGRVFVQTFDTMLGLWMGLGSSLCVFAPTCGRAVAMEPDGAVYACDHFVYPEFRLGRLGDTGGISPPPWGRVRERGRAEGELEAPECRQAASGTPPAGGNQTLCGTGGLPASDSLPPGEGTLRAMVFSDRQVQFGRDKSDRLPDCCRRCDFLFACNGECPKNRIAVSPDGQPGLNYLCPGLRRFFKHIDPWMKLMAAELNAGRPAAGVMQMVHPTRDQAPSRERASSRERKLAGGEHSPNATRPRASARGSEARNPNSEIGPNAPCPCGSGKKFKKCCGRIG